ncbi:MAG: TetR family transcriptional regulator [Candidatus Aminicenantes bacterium]|jgi:AcrR family transcriptional regulator
MHNNNPIEPKQRILDAAISLFAQKGFASVGVREIAKEANVNIAMISYYFEGKTGILKSILEEFFEHYSQMLRDAVDEGESTEEGVRKLISHMVDFIRGNTELAIVAYNELPLDLPELAELKAEKIRQMIGIMSGLIKGFGLDPEDTYHLGMIGPSLISMVFMNFRIQSILRNVFKVKFDDTYYDDFKETIAILFLSGIQGIADKRQTMKRKKS